MTVDGATQIKLVSNEDHQHSRDDVGSLRSFVEEERHINPTTDVLEPHRNPSSGQHSTPKMLRFMWHFVFNEWAQEFDVILWALVIVVKYKFHLKYWQVDLIESAHVKGL